MLGVALHLSPITGSGWDFSSGCGKSKSQQVRSPCARRAQLCLGLQLGREQPLISKVMGLVWVLQDLGSSAGPVSLTCEIWIWFFNSPEP